MRHSDTQVLVIGGGATGAGILRDLAMRGVGAILVEKRDLTHGTTGRFHGLLHSGGRYVVRDPAAAAECIQENRVLRRIMPQCIEDTGGFFVVTPWDDPDFADRFVTACHQAGVPVEEVTVRQMLREEPHLNPNITRCFRVPDASADAFLATRANVEAARQYGARALTYHEVTRLLVEKGRVIGAVCRDLVSDEDVTIYAGLVVNAAGAWAGQIAASAGLNVPVLPGKGVMIAFNQRPIRSVINRCRPPSDGDIFVPTHSVAIMGTTDVPVSDPEHFVIEPWEIQLMLDEGEKLVPGLKTMRVLRCWAGVRPLYKESDDIEANNRQVTRTYALLDHEMRDAVEGLLTIVGGKWTTYRLMAQVTVDKVCAKLGIQQPCRTHLESLPGAKEQHYHWLGAPLARIEDTAAQGELVCECELAKVHDVTQAVMTGDVHTLDDIRRQVRLGMGPCQGGFCTYRAAGILHSLRRPPVEQANLALRDYLQERWKGLLAALAGQQLRQQRLNELIYGDVLNVTRLPGPVSSRLACVMYEEIADAN